MDVTLGHCCHLLVFMISIATVSAVPPEACFANFRWDDCGKPPQPVMYYWKPGSRCEVGLWRGCLPNPNMFHDEYECINTCIFVARARPEDYHSQNDLEEMEPEIEGPVDDTGNTTDADETQATDVTGISENAGDNNTASPGEETTGEGETRGDGANTGAGDNDTTSSSTEPPSTGESESPSPTDDVSPSSTDDGSPSSPDDGSPSSPDDGSPSPTDNESPSPSAAPAP